MKAVNIYSLTRISDTHNVELLERTMSRRKSHLPVKSWEIQGLKETADNLYRIMGDISSLDFFYSFQIPKLGKEFDLLRISDECIINIELKSRPIPDEGIKKQLEQNRYYLASFGISIRSYTYISTENRIVRLTNGGRLVEASWQDIAEDIQKQQNCFEGDVETLFKEEDYLLSPLTDPERFLQQEYFLTSQQKDIRDRVIKNIKNEISLIQGFTGLPGTGKTLLLYDIAMKLSVKDKVSVLHFGAFPEELVYLDERLKRIDFFRCRDAEKLPDCSGYKYILIDEGHRMSENILTEIADYSATTKTPVVISYDLEDSMSPCEKACDIAKLLQNLPDFLSFRMTNRIRTNSELSAFIRNVMRMSMHRDKRQFPSVSVMYCNNVAELEPVLKDFQRKQYVYICDSSWEHSDLGLELKIDYNSATCREYDKVVMVLEDSFYYDEEGYLRKRGGSGQNIGVRDLFHGLSRAKKNVALIVLDNEEIFGTLLRLIHAEHGRSS